MNKILKYPKTALAFIAAIVYMPTLFFSWVYLDDFLIAQEGGFYANIANIPAAFTRSVWLPSSVYNYYRPIPISVHILGAWASKLISGSIEPWIFHLTNIGLQVLVIVLLFVFFRALGTEIVWAFAGALLAVLHPVSAGTVSWISGQNELLLSTFMLAGFICFVKAADRGSKRYFAAFGVMWLAGLLTKENAAVLPVLAGIYLFLDKKKRGNGRLWAGLGLTTVVFALIWIALLKQSTAQGAPAHGFLAPLLGGIPYTLVYLGRMLLPVDLHVIFTPIDTGWWFWAAGVVAFAALTALTFRKFKPLAFLGGAWFLGFVLPTFANFIPAEKNTFMFREDRAYLAAAGVWLALLQTGYVKRGKPALILAASAVVLAALNIFHQFDYRDGMAYYQDAVRGSPRLAFAHVHLGDMYLTDKRFDEAVVEYKTAIGLNDREPQAHNNLGVAYLRMQQLGPAEQEFRKELEYNKDNMHAWANLAQILFNRGSIPQAEEALRSCVDVNPRYTSCWQGLATIYKMTGNQPKLEEALKALQDSEWDPRVGL